MLTKEPILSKGPAHSEKSLVDSANSSEYSEKSHMCFQKRPVHSEMRQYMTMHPGRLPLQLVERALCVLKRALYILTNVLCILKRGDFIVCMNYLFID